MKNLGESLINDFMEVGIPIDNYFYSGRAIGFAINSEKMFLINMALHSCGVDALIGPAFDNEKKSLRPEDSPVFLGAIYIPEKSLPIKSGVKYRLSLGEALKNL